MFLNLCTIILPFLLSCTNRRCANLPRMSVRAYGRMKRKKISKLFLGELLCMANSVKNKATKGFGCLSYIFFNFCRILIPPWGGMGWRRAAQGR